MGRLSVDGTVVVVVGGRWKEKCERELKELLRRCSGCLALLTSHLDGQPTGPHRHDLDQTYCLVLLLLNSRHFGLHSPPLKLLLQTRLPQVRLWTELHNFCWVPHHGASLPPKRSGTKNCDLNSLPPWLQKSFAFHWVYFV